MSATTSKPVSQVSAGPRQWVSPVGWNPGDAVDANNAHGLLTEAIALSKADRGWNGLTTAVHPTVLNALRTRLSAIYDALCNRTDLTVSQSFADSGLAGTTFARAIEHVAGDGVTAKMQVAFAKSFIKRLVG